MSEIELWRVVPSMPELLASSMGRIMIAPYIHDDGPVTRQYGGWPTTGQWDGDRYIYARRGYKTQKVARLVCEAFNGMPPFDGAVCMHLDENSRNNRPTNLAWGTQKENLNAAGFIEYCKGRTGENSPRAKWAAKKVA